MIFLVVTTINFNIAGGGPQAISLSADLPVITDPVILDATTQTGYSGTPLISIAEPGFNLPVGFFLDTGSDGSVIRGFEISLWAYAGILAIGSDGNTIEDNALIFNDTGIEINSDNNIIQGNFIGTNASGDFLANAIDGIRIIGNNNIIGADPSTPDPLDGNLIGFNGGNGVNILAGAGNSILSNIIHPNNLQRIDLGNDGPTFNDPGDVDIGVNNLQNFPELTLVQGDGAGNFIIEGVADFQSGGTYRLEFFVDIPVIPDQLFLGSADLVVPGPGPESFTYNFPIPPELILGIPVDFIATATDSLGNTSEFSDPAQFSNTISGRVFEDLGTLGVKELSTDDILLENVDVHLYQDVNSNNIPDAIDSFIASTTTDVDGFWEFILPNGDFDYWVAVDSKTIGSAPLLAEQTMY